MRILLVDDDEPLMETLAESLIRQRYAVDLAIDGETALEFIRLFSYDLIVLDMLLPDMRGIELCQMIRQQGFKSPILMLTASDTSSDKVQALDAGADDYVVKPFDFDELSARIRALFRRDSQASTAILTRGELSLNPSTFEVFYGRQQLHTTPKEYAMLEMFLHHPNRVFSLDSIIENLWSFDDPPSGDAVRTHIKGLRQKLRAGGAPKDLIETVYGLGYRIKPLDTEQTTSPIPSHSDIQHPTKTEISEALATAWENHKDTMHERLNVLEATATALDIGQLDQDLQNVGRSHAHKLAGSLGCFGFSEGSRLAKELEHLLQLEVPLGSHHASRLTELVKNLRQNLSDHSKDRVVSEALASAPQLLIIGAKEYFSRMLIAKALARGIKSKIISDFSQALIIIKQKPSVDGILLCLDEENFNASIEFIHNLGDRANTIPIFVMTGIQNFQTRLIIAQHGIERIFPASASPGEIIQVLQQRLQDAQQVYKIVILDDDSQVLEFVKTILLPWGFQLITLDNPNELWSTLNSVQPNLLILDIEMPEISGIDICQVIRTDETWHHLPIIFLTAYEDQQTQHQVFDVGADDFISKSTMAVELPARIINRLKRSHFSVDESSLSQ